ncbi:MAG: hypothetical protein H0Z24_04165 [Thermosipho sp. (in: Bacteria)]|nr:hypothetical protein [Thermosipho sp. (in: thermotogales)]
MNKKFLILILVVITLMYFNAFSRNLGVGFILGEPTGLSFKNWKDYNKALTGAVSWSLINNDSLYLHADCLFYKFNWIKVEENALDTYYGIGGKIKLANQIVVGVRFPVGISFNFKDIPFEFFFEIVPTLNLLPASTFEISGGLGMRYYFEIE